MVAAGGLADLRGLCGRMDGFQLQASSSTVRVVRFIHLDRDATLYEFHETAALDFQQFLFQF